MSGVLTFGLLGSVELWRGEVPCAVGGPRTRAVLAALLLQANQVVTVERLIDAAWGDAAPASARAQAQNRVSGLRQLLRSLGEDAIETHGVGYLIRIDPGQLDVDVFESRVGEGREQIQRGELADGAATLRSALAVWRGSALEGSGTPRLVAAAQRLEEARLAVREELIDVELELQRHEAVIGELVELVAEHPWRERLSAQLMTALHRANRRRDALAQFDLIRRRLSTELGVDPGPELVRLRDAILRTPYANETVGPTQAEPQRANVPRQLPAPVRVLIGRDEELRSVAAMLRTAREAGASPVVVAIAGPAGVGKSALAVAAGHATSADFPDGQLYVDLQGAQAAGLAPLTPDDVVGRFLRALGVAAAQVPISPGEAAALYRTMLAPRRLIVIADNAGSAQQVMPLLPATGGCAVIVTSRQVLGMLDGDVRLDLSPLSADAAAAMLASLVGADRAAAEPQAVEEVARACGYLPLALKVAGARLVSRPDWGFADLSRRLGDERRTMNELNAADETLRASLRVSWLELTGTDGAVEALAAATFLALGALRVPTVERGLVAAVIGTTPQLAELALDRLVEVRLLDVEGGRYRMHDVLRMFAAEIAARDPATGRDRPAMRALRWYVAGAERVNLLMRGPNAAGARTSAPGEGPGESELTDPISAGRWLDAELANLVALVRHALVEATAVGRIAGELALALYPAILMRGHGYEWEVLCKSVLDAADRLADPRLIASIWTKLAVLYGIQHRVDEALDAVEQALSIHRIVGDLAGEASTLEAAGMVQVRRGKADLAVPLYEKALRLRHDLGDAFAEGITLSNAAQAYHQLGRHDESLAYLGRSLELRRECGDLAGEAISLLNLGEVHLDLNRIDVARSYADAAIECSRRAAERENERRSVVLRARVLLRSGAIALALKDCETGTALAHAVGGPIDPTEFAELIHELEIAGEHEHAERVRRRIES